MNKLTRKNKKHKCVIYKSCHHVPCGTSMNGCKPEYCYSDYHKGSSKSWSYCNMGEWGGKYKKYLLQCQSQKKCKIKKSRKDKNSVDVYELHNKMPYIWRYLKPKTRKYMIQLAKKSVKKLNIPFSLFNNRENKKYINKITKNMTRENKKKFYSLRHKFRDI